MSFSKIDRNKKLTTEKGLSNTSIFKMLYPERNLRVNPIDPYRLKPEIPAEVTILNFKLLYYYASISF